MGLFSFFFKRKSAQFTERIWLSTDRKLADLVARVRADRAAGICPVVIAHFRATHAALTKAFEQAGVTCHVSSGTSLPASLPAEWQTRGVTLLLAPDEPISSDTRAAYAQPKNAQLPPVAIHLAEHYPLATRDQQILDLDQLWPQSLTFTCYTGLDEAWLQPFGADRLIQIMKRLDLQDDEVLSHHHLNQSLRSAQAKLAATIKHEQRCDDCTQWLRINFQTRG